MRQDLRAATCQVRFGAKFQDAISISFAGAFCGLGIFGIKFREILMKTTVQNNKNSGNFCIFFIQNSGNFYEKKQLLDVFFPRNSGNFCCFELLFSSKFPGIFAAACRYFQNRGGHCPRICKQISQAWVPISVTCVLRFDLRV